MVTTLSRWLNEEAKKRNWSLREVARRGKVSSTAIINVANGTDAAGPKVCAALARAFEAPEELVYQLAGILPDTGEIGPEVKDWNRRLSVLTAEDKRRTIQAMDSVLTLAEQLAEYVVRPSSEPDG